jgi:DNA-binding SARP family transcriptional activator
MTSRATGELALLGPFRLTWRERPVVLPFGAQRVVAFLALVAHGATRRGVHAALWPDADDAHARATLRSTLWRIHRRVPELVRSDGQRLSLHPDLTVDADELDRVAHASLADPAQVVDDGLGILVRSEDVLADWEEDWVVVERERLRQLRLAALEEVAGYLTERGDVGQAVEAGLAAVANEPFRESAHRVLIEAYLREGNVAEANEQFGRLRRTLSDELGVLPSPELTKRLRTARPTDDGSR